jgi:hypothetical protein
VWIELRLQCRELGLLKARLELGGPELSLAVFTEIVDSERAQQKDQIDEQELRSRQGHGARHRLREGPWRELKPCELDQPVGKEDGADHEMQRDEVLAEGPEPSRGVEREPSPHPDHQRSRCHPQPVGDEVGRPDLGEERPSVAGDGPPGQEREVGRRERRDD